MSVLEKIYVPDIGDFKNVPVIEVLVMPGDTITAEQSLMTLESDKATMDVPSPHAGIVKEVHVAVGSSVSEGVLIVTLETAEGKVSTPIVPNEPKASPAQPTPVTPTIRGSFESPEVRVPDLGDFKDVPVIEVLVKPGDTVTAEQSLITLESDKATMDVPAPRAGVIKAVHVAVGTSVSEGTLIVTLEGGAISSSLPSAIPTPVTASVVTPTAATATPQVAQSASAPAATTRLAHASPSIRRFARELGVEIGNVVGTGATGRITKEDIQAYVKAQLSKPAQPPQVQATSTGLNLLPWPQVDFSKFGPIERKPLSRIKKISGANLSRNWMVIPHVTNFEDADITELESFRVALNKENAKAGIKLTMTAFLIKAMADALKRFPDFGASIDGEELVLKQYYHIGFAADTPNGLVVPVIRDADKKGIFQIAAETGELAALARDGKLKPADMQGGCISVSSLGGIGGTGFTPIINAPEVSILGVTKAQWKPVWDGKQFQPRLILPLCLSWDHRVIDGAAAARFLVYLSNVLADFRRVLL